MQNRIKSREVLRIQKMLELLLMYSPYRLYTFTANEPLLDKQELSKIIKGHDLDYIIYEPIELAGGLDNLRTAFAQYRQDEEERCAICPKRLNCYEVIEVFNALGGRFKNLYQYEQWSGVSHKTMIRKKEEILAQIASIARSILLSKK